MATINGTAGNDTLVGTTSTDTISGLGGNDLLQGSGGNDSVLGGAGNDTVRGNDGTDWVEGGAGNDNLGGGGGQDSFVFREASSTNADVFNDYSSGWDNIQLDAAFFTALGSTGQFTSGDARFWSSSMGTAHDADDRIIYNTTTRQLWYDADGNGSGAALLIGTLNTGATVIATDIRVFGTPSGGSGQTINGTSGNDSLVGGAGNDTINGFAGVDTINGGAGADSMVGGADPDTYFVDNTGDIIVEFEDGGFDTVNASVSYTLAAWVNHLTLTGSAALNGTGNELPNGITGNSGANVLAGRGGNDTLTGGGGADSFLFDVAPGTTDADSLIDFASGQDKITVDGNFHASTGASGNFAAGDARFWSSTSGTAHDSDDRVLYNTTNGQLWYDADGNGGGGAQLIATLQGASAVTATDIAIVNGSGGGGSVINGTSGNDSLAGGASAETINGFAGNDTLSGGGGNDTIDGGDGLDRLTGGAGADDFAFTSDVRSINSDAITDFVSGIDRLNLEPARFDLIGAGGRFAVDDERFYAAARLSGAHDATDRVLYDTESGAVLYDLDGNGPGVAILVARLEGAPTLAATDIFVDTKTTQPAPSYRTVQQTGSSDNRIDVVIIGDGYTASEISTVYAQHVDGLTAYMFNDSLLSQPFGRYESFFNMYAIELVSNESGTDNRATGEFRDTALNSFHNGDGLFIADSRLADEAVADALAGTGIAVDMRFMPINTDFYGGAGSAYPTYSAANFWANEIALHEAGHSFAGLADQYFSAGHWTGSEPSQPDVTTDSSGAKWAQWLGYNQPGIGVIGAYEGGLYNETGIYRPSENSKMRSVGQPFDAVGREQFVLEFYEFVDPLDAWLNNAATLSDVDELWVDAIDADIISVDWTINGTTHVDAGERISLSALGYFDGEFTVTARAYDPTDWVRVADRSSLEQSLQWTVVNDETGGGGEGRAITGTSGHDPLVGGPGNDTINGLSGNDTLVGNAGDDSLTGGDGHDSFDGGAGNDTYVGLVYGGINEPEQVVDAGGVDTVIASEGIQVVLQDGIENLVIPVNFINSDFSSDVTFDGNDLNNTIRVEGDLDAVVIVAGGPGNDTLIGGPGHEEFGGYNYSRYSGDYGNDFVDGGGGLDDLIAFGDESAAVVDFRTGTASGGGTSGTVTFINIEWAAGGSQNDLLRANDSGIRLDGWLGNDTLIGGAGADLLAGAGINSFLTDHDSLDQGNDELFGRAGNDTLIGGPGSDTLSGGLGNDSLDGEGEDGEPGSDTFLFDVAPGASNADSVRDLVSGRDNLVLDGAVHASSGASGNFSANDARFWASTSGTAHDGDDRVIYNTTNGQLWYDADGTGSGAAQLIATFLTGSGGTPSSLAASDISIINGSSGGGGSTINGTSGNDTLTGTAGNDTINGLGGNDLFVVGSTGGADSIDGGAGTDSIEFRDRATSGVTVEFSAVTAGTGSITGGSPGTISFTAVERIVASNFADTLSGGIGGQTLTGQGGADTLWGSGGIDTLWGGGGNDAFVFREMGSTNADRVSDFASGADKLQLDDAAFAAIGALGNFAAGDGRFWAAAGASAGHDVNDRVIYNTSSGALYYDADGSGSGAAQLVATLTTIPAISATDIAVI